MQLRRLLRGPGQWPPPVHWLSVTLSLIGMSLSPSAGSLDPLCPAPPPPAFFFSLNSFPPTALSSWEKKPLDPGMLFLASVYFCKCSTIRGWSFGQPEPPLALSSPDSSRPLCPFPSFLLVRVSEQRRHFGFGEKQSQGNTSNYANLRALNLQILCIFG